MQDVAIPQHPVQTTDKPFASLGLSPAVLTSVARVGFDHPTPIQAAVIPDGARRARPDRPRRDRLRQDRRLHPADRRPARPRPQGARPDRLPHPRDRAPDPGLPRRLRRSGFGLRTVCLIGGVKMGPQIRGLAPRPHVIVATPGRLLDHVEQGRRGSTTSTILVLDEADHMLDMGFMPQVQPHPPGAARRAADADVLGHHAAADRAHLAAVHARPDCGSTSPPRARRRQGISHRLYLVETENKKACLLALLHQELGSTLVFIRRKSDAEWLSRVLEREGHPVERIHSNLSQGQRVSGPPGLPRGRAPHPGGDRHRRPRPRHPARRPHHQLRHARDRRGLHPPRRPHRPRQRYRHRLDDRHLDRQADDQGDRGDARRGAAPLHRARRRRPTSR